MKKYIFAACLLAGAPALVHAQSFAEKANAFSYSKDAYLYLESGDSVIGPLQKVDYKKGLINEVKMRVNGEKQEIDISTIRTAYFPISALGRLNGALDQATTASKWEQAGLKSNLLGDGYVLFEKAPVIIKGKEEPALVQLLNPGFSDKIRVYADFNASESNSYGIGGVTLVGGDDLSYYIRKGDSPAERVRRKDFKGRIATYFGDCPTLANQLEKSYDWPSLPKYISQYSDCK